MLTDDSNNAWSFWRLRRDHAHTGRGKAPSRRTRTRSLGRVRISFNLFVKLVLVWVEGAHVPEAVDCRSPQPPEAVLRVYIQQVINMQDVLVVRTLVRATAPCSFFSFFYRCADFF